MSKLHRLLAGVAAVAALAVFGFGAGTAQAEIMVGSSGVGPLPFDSAPTVADGWSTLTNGIGTGSSTYGSQAALTTAVQTLAASSISNALPTLAADPVNSGYKYAYWQSTDKYLATTPSGVGAVVLMATLQNATGGDVATLNVGWNSPKMDTLAQGGAVVEQGFFYSLTGNTNSWTNVAWSSTTGARSESLNLGTWAPGSNLYLLWIDDNGAAPSTYDGPCTIDNFSASPSAVPEPATWVLLLTAALGWLVFRRRC